MKTDTPKALEVLIDFISDMSLKYDNETMAEVIATYYLAAKEMPEMMRIVKRVKFENDTREQYENIQS